MSKERKLTRRGFIKGVSFTAAGLVIGPSEEKSSPEEEQVELNNEQELYLPLAFNNRKESEGVGDLVELIDDNDAYEMMVNPDHSREEWQTLLQENDKSEVIFHWVNSEEEVPWAGAPQKGREYDGETDMQIAVMQGLYSEDLPKEVSFWIWTNSAYYEHLSQEREKDITELLSGKLSYEIWRATIAHDRGYLWGEFSLRQPTPEEVERYFTDHPLVSVSQ